MTLELYVAFVAAVTVLMLIPGPNVALITANSVGRGVSFGLMTVAGTCAAMVVQLAVAGFGMTAALGVAGRTFAFLRWVGVAYLLWLGLRAWLSEPPSLAGVRADTAAEGAVFLRGFLVSLTNPKTLFFYAAFFPQFVEPRAGPGQVWLLAASFLVIAAVIDCCWALLAARLAAPLARFGRLRNRLTGAALITAGAGLAAARHGG